jgi:hypothetical protein
MNRHYFSVRVIHLFAEIDSDSLEALFQGQERSRIIQNCENVNCNADFISNEQEIIIDLKRRENGIYTMKNNLVKNIE